MSEINQTTPSIDIYEEFQIDSHIFGAVIVAEINELQYFRDVPIFLKYVNPILLDSKIYIEDPISYVDSLSSEILTAASDDGVLVGADAPPPPPTGCQDPEALKYCTTQVDEMIKSFANGCHPALKATINDLNDLVEVTEDDPQIQIPIPNSVPDIIEIKNENGDVIETIQNDLNSRETNSTPQGDISISILNTVPDEWDDITDIPDDISISTLDDAYIKTKLWITSNILPDFMDNFDEDQEEFLNELDDVGGVTDIPDQPNTTEILKKIEFHYGIPLITLSKPDVPFEDSIMLQIDTKKDFTLSLTNVVGVSPDMYEVRIDKPIPPNTKFMAAFMISGPKIFLYLKLENDPNLYNIEVVIPQLLDLSVSKIGADNYGIKSLCGKIYDFAIWNNVGTPETTFNLDSSVPFYPQDSIMFDNDSGKISGPLIYPIGDYVKPAYNHGKWFVLENYKFIYHGAVDKLFCRENLTNTDFTIGWYTYLFGYPDNTATFISDNINNNYIRYDFLSNVLHIQFNGYHYQEYILLPEFMWAQYVIRFDRDTGRLLFTVTDFANDRTEEIDVYVGRDLKFELVSLFGEIGKNGQKSLTELSIHGFLWLNFYFARDTEIEKIFKKHKQFLSKFDPKVVQQPYSIQRITNAR